jgi:hypothetical protein
MSQVRRAVAGGRSAGTNKSRLENASAAATASSAELKKAPQVDSRFSCRRLSQGGLGVLSGAETCVAVCLCFETRISICLVLPPLAGRPGCAEGLAGAVLRFLAAQRQGPHNGAADAAGAVEDEACGTRDAMRSAIRQRRGKRSGRKSALASQGRVSDHTAQTPRRQAAPRGLRTCPASQNGGSRGACWPAQ